MSTGGTAARSQDPTFFSCDIMWPRRVALAGLACAAMRGESSVELPTELRRMLFRAPTCERHVT